MGAPKLNWVIPFSLFISGCFFLPTFAADVAHWDEYWIQKRAVALTRSRSFQNEFISYSSSVEKSGTMALDVFGPMKVTGAGEEGEEGGQEAEQAAGGCTATNIIDRCWRCDPNWADDRKKLADCGQGFGRMAKGGKGGRYYVVTDPSDHDVENPRKGTLRHAVIQERPLWIVFDTSMNITLSQELIMQSNKTIDGRGVEVHISNGAGFTIQFVGNIIISNIYVHDIVPTSGGMIRDSVEHMGIRTHDEGDGISIFGSRDIWLDHITLWNCSDGLIDAVAASTGITVSNCFFTRHDKVMLLGASDHTDVDRDMKVTVAFNHFAEKLVERMPRCRQGFFHVVNNDYTEWQMYAIGGSHEATIISQGNRFYAPTDIYYAKEVTHRDAPSAQWKRWTWVSDGDMLLNGAKFVASGDRNGAHKYADLELIEAAPASQVAHLTKYAGFLPCEVGKPC